MKKRTVCLILGIVVFILASYIGIKSYTDYQYKQNRDSWIADGMKSIDENARLLDLSYTYLALSLSMEYDDVPQYDTDTERDIRRELFSCMVQTFRTSMDSHFLYGYDWRCREELINEVENLLEVNTLILEHAVHDYAELDATNTGCSRLIEAYNDYNLSKVKYAQNYASDLINHMSETIADRSLMEELNLICKDLSQDEFEAVENTEKYENFFCDYVEYFCSKDKKSFVSSLVRESVCLSDNCIDICEGFLEQ